MRKFMKISGLLTPFVLSIALFALESQLVKLGNTHYFVKEVEIVCYAVWCFTFVFYFFKLCKILKSLWSRISAGVATSLLITVAVVLANNYWRWIETNNMFGYKNPIPYKMVLSRDISYTNGFGEYRYPILLIVMLIVCAVKIFALQTDFRQKCSDFFDRLGEKLYYKQLFKADLEELYLESLSSGDERFFDYLESVPVNEENKAQLVLFWEKHNSIITAHFLITRFCALLTPIEYEKISNSCIEGVKRIVAKERERLAKIEMDLVSTYQISDNEFDTIKDESEED